MRTERLRKGSEPNLYLLVDQVEIRPHAVMRGGIIDASNLVKINSYNLNDISLDENKDMIVHRSIVRYHSLSNEFREFSAGCDNQFYYYGNERHRFRDGVSRCSIMSVKKECNSKNCPLWDYDKNDVRAKGDYDTNTSKD